MQSLFYPHKENIFDLFDYLKKLIDIAYHLGVKILVFGSPKNRNFLKNIDFLIVYNFFEKVNSLLINKNIYLCIEPVAIKYGCEFLSNSYEAVDFIKKLSLSNIKLHLDLCTCIESNENIFELLKSNLDIIYHIHFSIPDFDFLYKNIYVNLYYLYKEINTIYKHRISIEINKNCTNIIDIFKLKQSIDCVFTPVIKIIGAGIYGCHLYKYLYENYGIRSKIYDADFFNKASFYNQNRLHIGYHYPRSKKTRDLCLKGHYIFKSEYGFSLRKLDDNYYVIHNNSVIDFGTYLQIFDHNIYNYEILSNQNNDITMLNYEGIILVKDEYFIDIFDLKKHFYDIIFKDHINHKYIKDIFDKKNNTVFDCTNNQLLKYNSYNDIILKNEHTLIIYLKKKQLCDKFIGINYFDGNFFSIYPMVDNMYTLTSPLFNDVSNKNINACVEELLNICRTNISNFDDLFVFDSYRTSLKNKFSTNSCSRELLYFKNNNVHSFSCGKLTGIYDMIDIVKQILNF